MEDTRKRALDVETLYRDYYDYAFRTAIALTGSRDEAQDVVAEAFLNITIAVRNGKGPTDRAGGYLATVIRNITHQRARRANAERQAVADYQHTRRGRHSPDHADQVADSLALRGTWQAVHPVNRDALLLIQVHGHSAADVGRLLGVSRKGAIGRARRGREQLRAYLEATAA